MSRIHPLSIIVFLTGIVLAIVGVVLAIVFGVQHSKQQSCSVCPVQSNCQASLFSLRTGLQGVSWTPNLDVVGSPEFNKQQTLAQSQLQAVLQGSLASPSSNKAAQLDASPDGNNVVVSVTRFALATDGVTVIAFASGAVAGSEIGLTDLPTNYTTTFQQSLDQDDQVAKGGAVVSDDSTAMCETVDQQLPDLVTSATAPPTMKATTATCAPCSTTHCAVPTTCPHCPACPSQPSPTHCPNTTCPACPKTTVCPTAGYKTTKLPTTCPDCPTQTDCPASTTCPEPTVCPTDMAVTTGIPPTCPVCPKPTACPTEIYKTTLNPTSCPVCPTLPVATCPACPKPTSCPTEAYKTTLKQTSCPECPTQAAATCPVCPQPTPCPTQAYKTTTAQTTCPACPKPTACPTETYKTTLKPTSCPVCPTQPATTCPACPTPVYKSTLVPTACPSCPTQPIPTECPNRTCPACPTPVYKTTLVPTPCPACPTQPVPTECPNTTCPACPTQPYQTTALPTTCPVCPPPVTCLTNPPTTTPKGLTTPTTAVSTTSAGCTGIFEGDIAIVYEQTTTSIRTGVEKDMQDFIAGPLLFGSGLPYIINGLTTRVQLFPYGETEQYTQDTDFGDGPHFSKEMFELFASYNAIDSSSNFDEPVINDGLTSVMEATGHRQRNGAVIIVGSNAELAMDAIGSAQALKLRGWDLFVVSFDPREDFSGLASTDNMYYRNSSSDETAIASSIGQKLVQFSNPGCGPSTAPVTVQTPTTTTKSPVICTEIFEGDIAVVFEETITLQDNDVETDLQSYITGSLIFHKNRPYLFNGLDSRLQLFPYGLTKDYNLDLRFLEGPKNKISMSNAFTTINTANRQKGIQRPSINDGLNDVLASTDHGARYGAVIIVADSDQYVKKAMGTAESLQKTGWDVFVVSVNINSNFSLLTITDDIYYRTGNNDELISSSIAQKIVARSNNGCVPTGPTTAPVTTPTTTAKPTQCPGQSFYYGDIAIVFEQTQAEINIIPYAIHNFISFRLLTYFNNPYIIDGNTTRILLAPYANTVDYNMTNSYAHGPSSLDELLNALEPLDEKTGEFEFDSENIKDGLAFVRSAQDHDGRAGSVIIIGLSSQYVKSSEQASKNLQKAGYDVFTITFENSSNLNPLASKPEYAYTRYSDADEIRIASDIGAAILASSPCDPKPPPTNAATTVSPTDIYYDGKIAVIFEQTLDNIASGRENDIHDFITERLFYYPGTVFFLPGLTKALLFPYGNTTNYNPYRYYSNSVTSMDEIADQLQHFDALNQYYNFEIPNIDDSLLWVQNYVPMGTDGLPVTAIIIGYSDKFVQSSIYTANTLKSRGYQVFTVSFNESAVFDPLASSSDYVFTRRSVSDEINIATSIGKQILIGPPIFPPTTTATKPATTTRAAPDCNTFYGNLAIVFEETTELIYSANDDEQLIHNYIRNSLLTYKGNPYQVDGIRSRIMLAPYGDTTEYPGTYQSWEKGPSSLQQLNFTLHQMFTKTERSKLNDPNIEDGLTQIKESFDTENRLSAVVLIGYSNKYIRQSEILAKELQKTGYHVFTISFESTTDYSPLASDANSTFVRKILAQEDIISKKIGTWLMSQQQCATTKSAKTTPEPTPAVATAQPATTANPPECSFFGDLAIVFEETFNLITNGVEDEIHNFIRDSLLTYDGNPYVIDGNTSRIMLAPYGNTQSYPGVNYRWQYGPSSPSQLNSTLLDMYFKTEIDHFNVPDINDGLEHILNSFGANGRLGAVVLIGYSNEYVTSSQHTSQQLQNLGYHVFTISFHTNTDFSSLASDVNSVFLRTDPGIDDTISKTIGNWLTSQQHCTTIKPTPIPVTKPSSECSSFYGDMAILFEQTVDLIASSNRQENILHNYILDSLLSYNGNPYLIDGVTSRIMLAPYGNTEAYEDTWQSWTNVPKSFNEINQTLIKMNKETVKYQYNNPEIDDGFEHVQLTTDRDGRQSVIVLIGHSDKYITSSLMASKKLQAAGYHVFTISFNPDVSYALLASDSKSNFVRKVDGLGDDISAYIGSWLMSQQPCTTKSTQAKTTTLPPATPTSSCPTQNIYYGDVAVVYEETEDVANTGSGYSIHDFIAFRLFGYANNPYIVDGETSRILMVPYGDTTQYRLNSSYAYGPRSLEALNNMMTPIDEDRIEYNLNTPNMKTGLEYVRNAANHKGRVGSVILIGVSDSYSLSSISSSKALQRAGYNVLTVSFSSTGNFSVLASRPDLVFTRITEQDEMEIAEKIGKFLKSTSPCDPVPPVTGPPTTVITPTNKYSGNIAVLLEQTWEDNRKGIGAAIHDFIMYRLFNYPGNPYQFPDVTRALLAPYGYTGFYNLPTSYTTGSIRNQDDISDQLENFNILSDYYYVKTTDIRDGLYYLIQDVTSEPELPETVIIIGYSDEFVYNATFVAATLVKQGYTFITVSFNPKANFSPLASGVDHSFYRNSEQDELNIAKSITELLMNPTTQPPSTVKAATSTAAATTPKSCDEQKFYYGDIAIVFEESMDVLGYEGGSVIHDFIAFKLLSYIGNPYIIDGVTSRILLVPYGYTTDYGTNTSYANGPRALEEINNLLEPIDEYCEYGQLNSPNIKEGLQFVKTAKDHDGRAGNVILIGKSADYAKGAVGSSKALQKAGYNVFTVSLSTSADLSLLASNPSYAFTRITASDENTIADSIGAYILPTSRCDPLPQPTGPTTTITVPANPYAGNIAVIFEQTLFDIDSGQENAIHDFLTYRLFYYPGNPYNFRTNTKTLLVPYGETTQYNPSGYYGASPRNMDDISDELENFDYLTHEYFLESVDMRSGIDFVKKVPIGEKVPYTAIIVGYSDDFVEIAKIESLSLQSIGYTVFTISFNASQPLDSLATSAACSFTRNSEQDEMSIARSIGNMLTETPTTVVPTTPITGTTASFATGSTTVKNCVNQSFYFGDIAIVFEQTMNALQDTDGRDIHEFIAIKLLGVKNSPYLLDGKTTRLILAPYGYRGDYATTNAYSKGPISAEEVSDLLDDFNRYTIQYAFNHPDIGDGLQFVQKSPDHGSRVGTAIIVGFSSQFMQASLPYSQALQTAGYNVYTVSFSQLNSLYPLASKEEYSFTVKTRFDEDDVAERIAQAILATTPCDPNDVPTALPTTVLPPAKLYFGDIAVVYELTGNGVVSGIENAINNFITFRLFNYPGNPYIFDQVHTAMNIFPYGQTTRYQPRPYYVQGPKTQSDIMDLLSKYGDLAYQETLNTVNMADGLNWVSQNAEGHTGRLGAVFIIGFSDEFVASSQQSSKTLQDAGYQVFTISFNPASNFAPLATVPQYVFARTAESDEIGIAEQIGNLLLAGPPTTLPPPSTSAAPSSPQPTKCPGQDFYYGDIAILFEQTYQAQGTQMEYAMHGFINFHLLTYANNPYRIDGNTSRILLVPYGDTSLFSTSQSYAAGPSSLEQIGNELQGFDAYTDETKGGVADMKDGLLFVKNAEEHGYRVGSIIIMGSDAKYVKTSLPTSKSLQRMGYNVFTVNFNSMDDLSPLASHQEYAYRRNTSDDEDTIAASIGSYILNTTPCDPDAQPTESSTPSSPQGPTYVGNIAVVYEQTQADILNLQSQAFQNFITCRLFFYPGNPYNLARDNTQVILVPYGQTDYYTLNRYYRNGPKSMEDIADELEGNEGTTELLQIESTDMTDGLQFVLSDAKSLDGNFSQSVILIGSSDEFIASAAATAQKLKDQNYQVFTVSFNPKANFSPLSSGAEFAFTRNTEADEMSIARSIGTIINAGHASPQPSTAALSTNQPGTTAVPATMQPATTGQASTVPSMGPTHCPGQDFYYGDIAIVFEETYDLVEDEMERMLHDFIAYNLLSYTNNPYRIDGITSRILLVPYGQTSSFYPTDSYKYGPNSTERLRNKLEGFDLTATNSKDGTPNIKTGLQFVKSAQDHGKRVGSVIIVGVNDNFVQSSVASSKNLQNIGYNVFTVSFDAEADFSSLASKPEYAFFALTNSQTDNAVNSIGNYILSTSPCDPVHPVTYPPTTAAPPVTSPYVGNIAVVFEEEPMDLDQEQIYWHNFITYRLFYYDGNPYNIGKETQILLIPYGDTNQFNPTTDYKDGPRNVEEISNELETYDELFYAQPESNSYDIRDGLKFVEKETTSNRQVPATVIIIGSVADSVAKSVPLANTLKQSGYQVFTVSFDSKANFSPLSSGAGYSFVRKSEADEDGIAKSIADKLVAGPTTIQPSTMRLSTQPLTTAVPLTSQTGTTLVPTSLQPATTVQAVPDTGAPTHCPGQNFYYGDISIVFEETWTLVDALSEQTIHDFIAYDLLSYKNNPYIIDGNTSRILLVPYGETTSFDPTDSYIYGPKSIEKLRDDLESFDLTVTNGKSGIPNIKTGLQFVKSAQDHGNRVGSVIIVGVSDKFVKSSVASSKNLQSMGYNVFTVSFDATVDFSSLASKPEFAFTVGTESLTDKAVYAIGDFILSTSPCDPLPPPTYLPTTPAPAAKTPYVGNIAVVFEEEPMDLDDTERYWHNFITYRLFYYNGNPYNIGKETQILLIPYGETKEFNPTTDYKDGPINMEEIGNELETFDELFYTQAESNSYDIRDGLKFVEKETTSKRQVPTTVIIIGSAADYVQKSIPLANTLKQSGYHVFTVSFDPKADFAPLSSGDGYSFLRKSLADEDGIAEAIAEKLESGLTTALQSTIRASTKPLTTDVPVTSQSGTTLVPTSLQPATTVQALPDTGAPTHCPGQNFYYGDIAIVFEETYNAVQSEVEKSIHDFINFYLLSYENNPYRIDGVTTRILLVPYGQTTDFEPESSYKQGPSSLERIATVLEDYDLHVVNSESGTPNIKTGLQFVKSAEDHDYRVGSVIIIGASGQFIKSSVASSKNLQGAGYNYNVFTVAFEGLADFSSLASKPEYAFNIQPTGTQKSIDTTVRAIGNYILSTSPCDPKQPPTHPPTTPAPATKTPYVGNIAVVFEEEPMDLDEEEILWHRFITYRMFYYNGNPYNLGKKTQILLIPYGDTDQFNPTKDYADGPSSLEEIANELENYDQLFEAGGSNSYDIRDGLKFVEKETTSKRKVPTTVIIIGQSATYVQKSVTLANSLKKSGYQVFTVSFNTAADFSPMSSGAGYSFVRNTEADEDGIARAIAEKLERSLSTTLPPEDFPSTAIPTTIKSASPVITTIQTTGVPTQCPGQDFYYGDIAILFEETWSLMNAKSESDLHNFITYNLLTYLNNPYRIDGNTTRILLVPYGDTKSFKPETSYEKGPSSLEQIANTLESFDLFLVDTEIGTPDMKDGLQFVKSALDHGNRIGSVIIVGYSDQYVRTAVASSKNLQTMGYNVFTIVFDPFADFSSLASKPEFAYIIASESDVNNTIHSIGDHILSTSPCDPVPLPTYLPTTPALAAKTPYTGNIAVVFEETVTSLAAGNETSLHNFITYRLFAYDGNPYNLGAKTQILLIPYGETDQFNPTKAYSDGPTSIIEIANELENYDQNTDFRQFNSFDIRDGLKFVQKETKSRRKVPTTVIIIGQNPEFIKLSIPLAITLKDSGMEVFTVSFDPASNFSPLSSGDGYSFVRKSEMDEVAIARAIGDKLISTPVTTTVANSKPTIQSTNILPTTGVPVTNSVPTSTVTADCPGQAFYYGDLTIVYEESYYAYQIGTLPYIQNFIAYHLLSYPGNPFLLDGNTTRIMLVPFGETNDFHVTEYYSKGQRSVEEVTDQLELNNVVLQEFQMNSANMKDGLNYVTSAVDHGSRAGSIVIVGNSPQFVATSAATSKKLQNMGYSVFTVSIGLSSNYSLLASKPEYAFSQAAEESSAVIAKSIGDLILSSSPCDPVAPPTSMPTSPIPTGQPTYSGNIAVVFEEGYSEMHNGNGARMEDFIIYRLFFYPGSPYQFSDIGTKILLIPYGGTTKYNPSTAFNYGPRAQQDIAEELQSYDYIMEENAYDTYFVKNGLDFVLNSVIDPGAEPKSIIIIGSEYSKNNVAGGKPTANKLKAAGWEIFSVSFAAVDDGGLTDFTPLTSGAQYSFIRNTVLDEIGIAQSIEHLLVSTEPTMPSVAPTQPSCIFNGDISVLIEQTLNNIDSKRENKLHDFVSNALFTYPGNPYQIDGTTSRVLLVPYGITVEYDVKEKYSTGTKGVAELPTDLAHLDAQTNAIFSNTARISHRLQFVTRIKDHSNRQGVVVIVGFNLDDPDESLPLSKTLQSQGYHVFGVSFDPATNFSVITSDSKSDFLVNSENDFAEVAKAIGSMLVPGCSQTTGSSTTIGTKTSAAMTTGVPVTTGHTTVADLTSSTIPPPIAPSSMSPSTSLSPEITTPAATSCSTLFEGDIAVVFEQTTTLMNNGEENKIHQFIQSSLFSYIGNPYKINGSTTRLLLTAYGNSDDYTKADYGTGPQSRTEIADILGMYNGKTDDYNLNDPQVSVGLKFVSGAKEHGNREGAVIIVAYTDDRIADAVAESHALQLAGYHVITVSFNARTDLSSLASDGNSVFTRKKQADNDEISRAIGNILVPPCSTVAGTTSSATVEMTNEPIPPFRTIPLHKQLLIHKQRPPHQDKEEKTTKNNTK